MSGRTEKQVYVVDIVKKEVVKTLEDLEANKLVSVRNHQYVSPSASSAVA